MASTMRNIQNVNFEGLGLSPAIADIDMAGNSLVNLNMINGQAFPATAGISGYTLHTGALGSMYWAVEGAGSQGATGPTGPAQDVGGFQGAVTFNWNNLNTGDSGLVFNPNSQILTICRCRVLFDTSIGGNLTVTGNISSGTGSNMVGGVLLSFASISTAPTSTNTIGGWTLTSSTLYSTNMSMATTGTITTPTATGSTIGGVTLSNMTLSAGNSTIGGISLSGNIVTASGLSVLGTGTVGFSVATTVSALLTVSAAQVQNALSVSGLTTLSGLTVLNSVSANSIYSSNTLGAFGALNISGLATLSGTQIQNALSVSGLTTLSGLIVLNSVSANSIYSSNTLGAFGALNISGLGTISAGKILNNLNVSGTFYVATASVSAVTNLVSINSVPVIYSSTNSNILAGMSVQNLCGTNIVALGSSAAYNNSGSFLVALGCNAGYTNIGVNAIAIGSNAGSNNLGDNSVMIGTTAGQTNTAPNVIAIGVGAGFQNASSGLIAIGSNAGRANTFSNSIFIGNVASYTGPKFADSFTVYSKSTTTPFLCGDLSGRMLGIGKGPSAELDVQGSGIFSASLTANYGAFTSFNVSGSSSLSGTSISTTFSVSGMSTLSAANVLWTLSTNILTASSATIGGLTVSGTTNLSATNVAGTLSSTLILSTSATITTLSATSMYVSDRLTSTTFNTCGLATVSGLNVINTLSASSFLNTNATITTLSASSLNVSGLSILTSLSIQNTISANFLFTPNSVITTLSAQGASISGNFSVSGLSTLSGLNVLNSVSSSSITSTNATITTLSASSANISGAFSVSGLSTLSGLNVVSTISAGSLTTTYSVITSLSATNVSISGNLNVSGFTVLPNISGVVTFTGVPILMNNLSQFICFGISTGLRGLNVNAFGYSAGRLNTGSNVNAIGSNAAFNNSGNFVDAFGFGAGASNTGARLIAIGSNSGASNTGTLVVAIGDYAGTTNTGTNVIGIGNSALFNQKGNGVNAIGTNAGINNTGNNSIFIGQDAGSNNIFSNTIIIGNNPSYAITSANTFLVYSSTSAAPFLQGDMSNIYLGIGRSPTSALDVSGSTVISRNLTVSSGTTTLSLANVSTLNVSSLTVNTELKVAATSTLSNLVVQATVSSSNVYVSNEVKLANSATLTMNGTFSNIGSTNLAGTSVSNINSIIWPTGTQVAGYVLTISTDPAYAVWRVPGAVSLAGWWNVAPTAALSMNSNGITNLPSINNIPIRFVSANNLIGIGSNSLSGGVTGSEIIALGISAGVGATGTNLIYLGSNPGGTQPYNNWFTLYSTTSGLPFLQGDMSNMRLGIGKTPTIALDVSGSVAITSLLNVSGTSTLTGTTISTLSATSAYVSNTLTVSGLTTLSGLNIPNALSVSGLSTLSNVSVTSTLSTSNVYASNTLTVSGLTTLSGLNIPNALSVSGLSTLSNVSVTSTLSTSNVYASNVLTVSGLATLSGLNIPNALSVSGLSTLSNVSVTSTLSSSNVYASNTLTVSGLATLSGCTVRNALNVCGLLTISGMTANGILTVCGQTLFTNLSFYSLNNVAWAQPASIDNGSILTYDVGSGGKFKWVAFQQAGIAKWAESPASTNLSMGNFGITQITSFNNISAVFISASAQIGIGSNVLCNNPASNIIALGPGAGSVGGNLTGVGPNNIFIGSNPGGSSNFGNSLVIYSQTAGSPLIYGDLTNNQVTIGGQTATGYTLNVNGSAQVGTLKVTNSATLAGVTASFISNTGSTILGGSVTIPGANTLGVSGQATFSNVSILTALSANDTYVSNGFGVGGTSALAKVTISGTLGVSGQATFSNVSILTALSANNAYVSNGFGVGGTTTLSGTVNMNGSANTFNVSGQSTFSSKVGIGGSPTYTLDVQTDSAGSNGMRIARNNATAVTAGLFLEAGFGTGSSDTGNRALVSFATRGGGGGDVVQSVMSIYEGLNYGLSIKNSNTATSATVVRVDTTNSRFGVGTVSPAFTLDVSGTFNVNRATTLSGVTLNILNGVTWPTTTGTANQQLVINQLGTAAIWADPGVADAALWSCNYARQTVDMAGYGFTRLTSINGLTTTMSSTTNQIGIGTNALTNNTATNVVAFGNGAGSNTGANSTWSNCVYLGANPGTTAGGANTFLLYSTAADTPALQVNMQSRQLGVGMVPSNALDVKGTSRVDGDSKLTGKMIIGDYGIKTPCNYAVSVAAAAGNGMIAFYNSTNQIPYVGIGYDQTNDGIALRTSVGATGDLNGTPIFITRGGTNPNFVGIGGMLLPAYTLDVSGQINTNTRFSSPSTSSNTIGGITMSNSILVAGTLSGTTSLNGQTVVMDGTTGLIGIGLNMTVGGTSNIALGNYAGSGYTQTGAGPDGGQLIAIGGQAGSNSTGSCNVLLGYTAGRTNQGSFVNCIGVIAGGGNRGSNVNAIGNSAALSNAASYVNAIGFEAGFGMPSSATDTVAIGTQAGRGNIGPSAVFIGQTAGLSNNGTGIIGIGSNACAGNTGGELIGIGLNVALSNTGTRVIALGGNAAVRNKSSSIVAIGQSAAGDPVGLPPGQDIIAIGNTALYQISSGVTDVIGIGQRAGSNAQHSNSIYLGSNSGYTTTGPNAFVVYSTASTVPALQADLLNRQLGVGMVPSNALDVSGTIRASGPVISTLNVLGLTGTTLNLTTATATTYYSMMTTANAIAITVPTSAPPTGTYWVLKNNSAVNYTITITNGLFNQGSNTYYLQSGIGITLAYSGTTVNSSPAYYTF